LSVVSIKVRRDVKEKILKYKDKVNWAEEIRRFIEVKLREIEAEENMRRVIEALSKLEIKATPRSSVELVREDRESH